MFNELVYVARKYYGILLTLEDVNSLMAISSVRHYGSGDVLCEVGDNLTCMGLVLNGIVRSAYITYDGKDITRYFHVKYSAVLDDCILGFSESKYRCEAVTDAEILMIKADKFKILADSNVTFGKIYTKSLESGIRYKIYRENELMTKNATERYKQFLLDFPELAANVKQQDIATYLGIEPQSLSRIKKSISEMAE